jgi:hypothetical protein
MYGASRAGAIAGSLFIALLLYIGLAGACVIGVLKTGVV